MSAKNKNLLVGFNTFENDVLVNDPSYALPSDGGKNVDFVVCHFDPQRNTFADACDRAGNTVEKLNEAGTQVIANFEFQNFDGDSKDKDGNDWANRPDGTHLLNLPEKYVDALKKAGNLAGIMYDEFEHVIINRNLSIELGSKFRKKLSAFPLCKTADVLEQGKLLGEQLKEYAGKIRSMGAPALAGEHVFPVLFHKFAENGLTPNFKSQKESYSDIQYAIASGAALEYGTDLWNCVDLWYRLTNPGHSPEEMYHNLLFAYLSGVNRVYVESCHCFVDRSESGAALNEYGKAFVKFSEEYKDKDRGYDVHDLAPEIAIIRYDDSHWGQCDPVMWKPMLFGNKKIRPDSRSKEYLKVFNILTHGETCKNGLSWGRISPWSLRPHKSFASLNSTVVFDGNVQKDKLESLKLCFLCGCHISGDTLKAVEELVRENGLTVVTSDRFAPANIRSKIKGSFSEIKDGKGTWIVVKNFSSGKLKKKVMPFAGEKGKIRLTFKDRTVTLKISENGEVFTIE